jgi:dTDP-4-amino-4,6-dideoxygalactose transaminase
MEDAMQKPAIAGGPKAKKHPYGTGKRFGADEIKELKEALAQETLFYVRGTKVKGLCANFGRMIGAKHVVAASSGTAAIHVALGVVGIRPGDEVITSPITDFGTVIGILYQNAIPTFADLDAHTYNMTPESIEKAVTRKTRAVLVVHLAGNSADMTGIMRVAKRHQLAVIEDCAQSILARYKGRPVGTIGDVGCFSLNDWKHISVGDGGLVVTNRDEWALKMAMFADKNYRRTPGGSPLREIAMLAPNYRMTELQGAVGLAQLRKVKRICRRRNAIGDATTKGISGIPGVHPHKVTPGGWCTYWFYMFRVDPDVLGCSRDEFTQALAAEGLAATAGYIPTPVYQWEIFRNLTVYPGSRCPYGCARARKGIRYPAGLCPESERILKTAIKLPVSEFFTATDVRETVAGIRKVAAYYLGKRGIQL